MTVLNAFSEDDRLDAMMSACIAAVAEHFSHLAVRDILDPPHQWFDAALARQIALHIMVVVFQVPKRRVVEMQGRSREAINRCLRTIDDRRRSPVFNRTYETMAGRARAMLLDQLAEAA